MLLAATCIPMLRLPHFWLPWSLSKSRSLSFLTRIRILVLEKVASSTSLILWQVGKQFPSSRPSWIVDCQLDTKTLSVIRASWLLRTYPSAVSTICSAAGEGTASVKAPLVMRLRQRELVPSSCSSYGCRAAFTRVLFLNLCHNVAFQILKRFLFCIF